MIVTVTEEPDDLADAAVEEYLRRVDAGEVVDQSAFLVAHPDSMDALRSFFDTLCLKNLLAGCRPTAETHPTHVGDSPIAESQSTPQMPWTSLPASFGRYFVEKLIGCGAMGAVYQAHDTQLDRPVALKLAHVLAQESPELRERLLKEARAAAGLGHPNICRVYDVGEIDGVRFIAMELIEGQPLSDLIRSGPLPTQTTVTIVRKLALALQAAHDKGIVHRDLKPSNVIVRKEDDEPVLMDFGLAHRPVITGEERLTQVGTLVGSPAYMSPEQVRADADAIGPATDVYGLGVVFYELLTGKLPFTGSVLSVLAKVLTEEPPALAELRPDIDPALAAICHRMLAKRSEDRFGSMSKITTAFDDWLRGGRGDEIDGGLTDIGVLTPKPRVRRAFGLFGLVVGVVALAAAVGGPHIEESLKPPDPPSQPLSNTIADAGEVLVDAGGEFVRRMTERVRGKKADPEVEVPAPPPPIPWAWYLSIAATSLGLVGAICGTVGWVRREDHRLVVSAIVMGSLAVAWVHIVAALVIAFLIMVLLLLLGSLGR